MSDVTYALALAAGIGATIAIYLMVIVPALIRFEAHHPAIAARHDAKLHR